VFLIVFMWNLYKCNFWLIVEVILQNARCNNKIYTKEVSFHKNHRLKKSTRKNSREEIK